MAAILKLQGMEQRTSALPASCISIITSLGSICC